MGLTPVWARKKSGGEVPAKASSRHVRSWGWWLFRLEARRPIDWAVFTGDGSVSAGDKILGMESVPIPSHRRRWGRNVRGPCPRLPGSGGNVSPPLRRRCQLTGRSGTSCITPPPFRVGHRPYSPITRNESRIIFSTRHFLRCASCTSPHPPSGPSPIRKCEREKVASRPDEDSFRLHHGSPQHVRG